MKTKVIARVQKTNSGVEVFLTSEKPEDAPQINTVMHLPPDFEVESGTYEFPLVFNAVAKKAEVKPA